jgi:hypothetical protein
MKIFVEKNPAHKVSNRTKKWKLNLKWFNKQIENGN